MINSYTKTRIDLVQIIPVIDLQGGWAVHARRGARAAYQPIRSSLTTWSSPVEIAAALLRLHPFESLYIADLDAIQGLGTNLPFIAAIHDAFPAVELWIDAGVADLRSWAEWKARSLGRIVIGTESKPEAALIGALRAKNAGPQPLLSLDFSASGLQDPADVFAQPTLWPDDVIVMTLARVGSGTGPDLYALAAVLARAGNRRVYAAGGIRDAVDLKSVRRLGAAGALIASALHDESLTSGDLSRIAERQGPPRRAD